MSETPERINLGELEFDIFGKILKVKDFDPGEIDEPLMKEAEDGSMTSFDYGVLTNENRIIDFLIESKGEYDLFVLKLLYDMLPGTEYFSEIYEPNTDLPKNLTLSHLEFMFGVYLYYYSGDFLMIVKDNDCGYRGPWMYNTLMSNNYQINPVIYDYLTTILNEGLYPPVDPFAKDIFDHATFQQVAALKDNILIPISAYKDLFKKYSEIVPLIEENERLKCSPFPGDEYIKAYWEEHGSFDNSFYETYTEQLKGYLNNFKF
jgi:hypothetical protein